jgi:hypothetical protein
MSEYEFESTPEDAWHPDDPIPELIRNLFLRAALLDGESKAVPDKPVAKILEELKRRVRAILMVRGSGLSDPDQVRANLILEDVEFIRAKNAT